MISVPISKYANNALVFKSKLLKKLKSDAFVTSKNNLDLLVVDMCIFKQDVVGKSKSTVIVWLKILFTSKHYCQFRWSSGNYFNLPKMAILKIYNMCSKGFLFFFFLTPLYNLPSLLSSIDISSTSISESGLFLLYSYCDILGQS